MWKMIIHNINVFESEPLFDMVFMARARNGIELLFYNFVIASTSEIYP